MKSEGTSSGFASASDSICKIFLVAKIFASGSDAFDSEYASFPPFRIKCISAKMSYLFLTQGEVRKDKDKIGGWTTSKIIEDETMVHSVKIKRWKRCSSHHTALLVKDLACSLAGSTFSLSDLPNMGAGEHKPNKFFFFWEESMSNSGLKWQHYKENWNSEQQ